MLEQPEHRSEEAARPLHFAGLNGFRAIAALAVVISHTTWSLGDFGLNPRVLGVTSNGTPAGLQLAGFGVSIFFALSGFLITYLLLVEKNKNGRISCFDFYARRALRIWPLYYIYLAAALTVAYLTKEQTNLNQLPYYLLFAPNIPVSAGKPLAYCVHLWSIGIEEQFYLLWPWIVSRVRNLERFIYLLTVTLIGVKLLIRFSYGDASLNYQIVQNARFQCMLIGAVGAIWLYEGRRICRDLARSRFLQAVCWLAIFSMLVNHFHIASIFDNEITAVLTVVLIFGQILGNPLCSLESGVWDRIGKVSYGLYVLHPLVIVLIRLGWRPVFDRTALNYIFIYIAVCLLSLGAASLSYRYFESYFLRFKTRFSRVASQPNATSMAV